MRWFVLAVCAGLLVSGCSTVEPGPVPPDPELGVEPLPEGYVGEDHWSRSPAAVPVMKIGRGATNILASPFDIPATVVRVSRETDNFGLALLGGTVEGVANCVIRLCAGVVEVLTFPLVYDADPFYVRELGARAIAKEPEPVP